VTVDINNCVGFHSELSSSFVYVDKKFIVDLLKNINILIYLSDELNDS